MLLLMRLVDALCSEVLRSSSRDSKHLFVVTLLTSIHAWLSAQRSRRLTRRKAGWCLPAAAQTPRCCCQADGRWVDGRITVVTNEYTLACRN
jgi:hypothetical protein